MIVEKKKYMNMLCKICQKNETENTSGICWECFNKMLGIIVQCEYNRWECWIEDKDGNYYKFPVKLNNDWVKLQSE